MSNTISTAKPSYSLTRDTFFLVTKNGTDTVAELRKNSFVSNLEKIRKSSLYELKNELWQNNGGLFMFYPSEETDTIEYVEFNNLKRVEKHLEAIHTIRF